MINAHTITRLLAALSVLLVVAGCGGDDDPAGPEPASGVIVPLAVGNKWIYDVYDFPPVGDPVQTLDSIVVVGDSTVGAETRYRLNLGTEQMVNRGNGLWYKPSGTDQLYLQFAYPADVGAGWAAGVGGEISMTLVSKSAAITVPEGTYVCWQYVAEIIPTGITVYYVAPNVGIIRSDRWDITGTTLESSRLLVDLRLE
jgi:hypothetical protein